MSRQQTPDEGSWRSKSSSRPRGRQGRESSRPRDRRSSESSEQGQRYVSPSVQNYGPPPQGYYYGPPQGGQQYGMYQQPFGPPASSNGTVHLSRAEYDRLAHGVANMQLGDEGKNHGGHATSNKSKTVWFSDVEGDVKVPEICVFSLSKTCKFDHEGCIRLHAKCPVQWQFQKEINWYNFRDFHSKELEDFYQKPDNDSITLPPLDPKRVKPEKVMDQMKTLLGEKELTVNFQEMKMKKIDGTEHEIRRIATHSSALTGNKMATIFDWYFKDELNNWVKYGQVNTANNADCVSNISSEDVEIKFIKEKVQTFGFSSSRHEYTIRFSDMVQVNKATNVERPIRRRPKGRPMRVAAVVANAAKEGKFPTSWTTTDPSKIFQKVKLSPSDMEYQFCVMNMKKTLPNITVTEIQRIQSPYLWLAFQNKKGCIKIMNNTNDVTEEFLFHGTDHTNVDAICEQNLDWRLHGTRTGQKYGRGSYFSSSASYSDRYCPASTPHGKTMLLVRVLVGTITQGSSVMSRPPLNSATGHLFDTTVDNVQKPTIYVKYDNQEYYPEYIVSYR